MIIQLLLVAGVLFATDIPTSVTAVVDKAVAEDKFSGVVLLAKEGKPIVHRAWGDGNRPDTKFNLGSINKIFTQVAIGQLAQAGKLSLSDTIRKHLPDYPSPVADKITIQQLIDHRSGLGDFFGPEFAGNPNRVRKLSDYVPFFVNKPLQFEPGTEQRYSNAGYIVLGLIIERLSGQSYYDYVREHIFAPAGMKDTESYELDAKVPNRAQGMTKRGPTGPLAQRQSNAAMQPGRGSSAGGGYSTAPDMLKFAQALSGDKLLSTKWTNWVFRDNPERRIGVAGGSPGVNAVMTISPAYTLVILSNFDPPSAEELLSAIRPVLGEAMPQRQQRLAAHSAEPDEVIIGGPVDLPMTTVGHLPVIEAKVNGKGPFHFAVDTGFGRLMEVSAALAEQLSLPVIGEGAATDPSGTNPAKLSILRAESIDVGSVHFGGVEIASNPRMSREVDGIIGLNLFKSLLVTLDYPNGRFRVKGGSLPAADGKDVLNYIVRHGVPAIDATVNGQTMSLDVDSGSPAEVTLPLGVAKGLTLGSDPQVVGHGRTVSGEFDVYAAPLKGEVRVGGITLTDPRIDFVEMFPVGHIGSRFLRNLVVTFDPENKRVRFAK